MFLLAQTDPIPIPPMDPAGLPSHWAIFLALYHVTFVLHLLFMNFSLGGSIVCLVNDVRSLWSPNADYLTDLNRRMFLVLPITISFAITFGVAPLLFVQVLYGQYFYTSAILIGLPWMGIIGVLIVVFYLAYIVKFQPAPLGPGRRLLRIVLAGVLVAGFATVAFLLTSNAVWSIVPEHWVAKYHGQKPFWPAEAHFWPRYVHNLIGGTAMACLLTAGIARALRFRGVADDYWVARTVRGFLLVAVALTLLQAIDGAVLVGTLRSAVREEMLLSLPNIHVWGWRVGLTAAIAAVIFMLRGVRAPGQARWPWLALASVVLTLGGMSMAREAVRAKYLAGHGFKLADWAVKPGQNSAFLTFLVSFVVALVVVGWMLWIAWRIPSRNQIAAPDPAEAPETIAPSTGTKSETVA